MAGNDVKTMNIAPKVWKNGKYIDWNDARIHVMSHVVNYGSSVFEGIRCYTTSQGPGIFRLTEHMQRLVESAKIYWMDSQYTRDDFFEAALGGVGENGAGSRHLR